MPAIVLEIRKWEAGHQETGKQETGKQEKGNRKSGNRRIQAMNLL